MKSSSKPTPTPNIALQMTCMRLKPLEAVCVGLILLALWMTIPEILLRCEPRNFSNDYRTPTSESEDYWQITQLGNQVDRGNQIAVIGDSVVWGEYVEPTQTLSSYLNEFTCSERYVNLGLNGLHPLAMEGLVRSTLKTLRNQHVILHLNLLWMSSPDRDLSAPQNLSFNHPRLIPQFVPSVPSYHADIAERLSIVIERHISYRQWVRHLWIQYLGGQDVQRWSLDHPDAIPFATQPAPEQPVLRRQPRPWQQRGIPMQDYPWVTLDTSLQWDAFRRTIELLESRDNQVYVIIGPFNAHLLTNASRQRWQTLRDHATQELRSMSTPCLAPQILATELYADASHPLAIGYRDLAKQVAKWIQE